MKKRCLFILMVLLGSIVMSQDLKNSWLNEKWAFGSGGAAFYSGTIYFFKPNGSFKVDYIYSGGQYIKTSSKGKYYYHPETQTVFLKFSNENKKTRGEKWSPRKVIEVAFSANDTIYTITTYNDWKKENGKYFAKGESTVFPFFVKFETKLGITLVNDTNGYTNRRRVFDLRHSFSREKMPDE
jgi:uncharacterized protein YkuJ